MGNLNAPFGLRAVRHRFGGTIRASKYAIADQYGTSLFTGDPVVVTGNGANLQIATAATDDVITGVFAGCRYVDLLGDTKWSSYWPAAQVTNTAVPIIAEILDDPFIEYDIQFDATGFDAAHSRKLANLVANAGNTKTGTSAYSATRAAGTETQLKLLGLSPAYEGQNPGVAQSAYGAYAIGRVMINTHEFNYKTMEAV